MTGPGSPSGARRTTLAASIIAAVLVAQQVGAKAARDALFLSHFGARKLPPVMAVAALLAIGSALVAGRFTARFGPSRILPALLALHAGAFALEHLASASAPAQVSVALYLHMASLGAIAASTFWSVVNERFDPYRAKRVIARIGAAATLGGVLGGLATERLGRAVPSPVLLLVLAVANTLLCAAALWWREPRQRTDSRPLEREVSGSEVLRRTPYLRDVALLVAMLAVTDICVDYVFKAEAARAFTHREDLLAFFALFYTVTAVLTFVVQWTLGGVALDRLGLGGTVAILPGMVLVSGLVAAVAPGLWSAVGVRGAGAITESSLYRSGYELLYTPLAPAAKRASKAVLDIAVPRLGTVAGSGVTALVLAIAPAAAESVLLLACAGLCAGCLLLSFRLHAGYVAQLSSSLRAGVVRLEGGEARDLTTRRTLAESLTGEPPQRPGSSAAKSAEPHQATLPELASILSGGDRAQAARVLRRPLAPELVAFALPLLGDDMLALAASNALKPLADRCTGQLIDALLDTEQPIAIRRRLPAILATARSERIQRGLFAALEDPAAEVRERSARALARMVASHAHEPCTFSEAEIMDAIRRELDRAGADGEGPESPDPHQTLRLVFALLELCLEREAAALSLNAILGSDSRLRGTALEYLDNVLPDDIRDRLWPELRAARTSGPKRSRDALVEALVRESQEILRT